MPRPLLAAVVLLAGYGLSPRSSAVVPTELTPHQPYEGQFSEPVTYEIDFRAVLTAPYHTEKLRVWIPTPPSDAIQQVVSDRFSTFPAEVEPTHASEPLYGNRFAYFEFDHPQGAQIIRRRLTVVTREVKWGVEAGRVASVDEWPSSFAPYLRSDESVAITPEIEGVVRQVSRPAESGFGNLLNAIDWVDANLTYDHSRASLQASSRHAITQRTGHCSDYHGLCSAFGRALRFPTRVTYGLALVPKNSPSHCKLEAFLPPYGWVSFDVSETQKLIDRIESDKSVPESNRESLGAAARGRLHSGFRESAWLLMTRGADYDLAPPAGRRVNVVRTLYAEADGEPLPEPDPADASEREYGWMTAHRYAASRDTPHPFKDPATLRGWQADSPVRSAPE